MRLGTRWRRSAGRVGFGAVAIAVSAVTMAGAPAVTRQPAATPPNEEAPAVAHAGSGTDEPRLGAPSSTTTTGTAAASTTSTTAAPATTTATLAAEPPAPKPPPPAGPPVTTPTVPGPPPPPPPAPAPAPEPAPLERARAVADSSGWDWRAAGVHLEVGFHPEDCCHWGVYDSRTATLWIGPTAFANPGRLRYVVLHELAHAWQYRMARFREYAADFSPWGYTTVATALEAGADCIASLWGAGAGHYWRCPSDARALAARRLAGDWS